MSDVGDDYRVLREMSREKRFRNRQSSLQMLRTAGLSVQVLNDGAHLVVGTQDLIDFWPGTGLWIERAHPKSKRRGVRNLIKRLKVT